jgi:uncharacterized protein (DUF58 family)
MITGRLVALAALGVALAWASAGLAAGWAVLLAAAAVADVARAARIGDLWLTREPSPAVRLGEHVPAPLLVENRGRRRLRALVRDAWLPSAGHAPRVQPVRVPPGGRARLVGRLCPTRRGERTAVEVTVRSFGPLGLAARQRRLAVPGSVRVLPAFASRRFLPEKLSRLRAVEGAVVVRQRGQGTEFDSLRGYVLGDDVRSIDWRATARSRDVVVRTWRPERDRRLVVAIDTGRSAAARLGDEPRLDAVLDACLLLTAVAARAGDRIGVVAADVALRARLGAVSGPQALAKVVDAIGPLEPALVETDPHLLAGQVLRQVRKRALVVLFGSLDTAADSGLLPAARALAGRHELVVASVTDPSLALLAAGRADPAEVYTAAAAEVAAAARRDVAEQLRRLGAHVVAAPADVFAAHVTDAYLDLKAAGRL